MKTEKEIHDSFIQELVIDFGMSEKDAEQEWSLLSESVNKQIKSGGKS